MARKDKRQRDRDRRKRREERRRSNDAGLSATVCPRSAADPICGTASTAIDPSLCWYIARTAPRMGVRALAAMQEAQAVTFQPRASEVVLRRGRRVVRRTPLLIRTVFIGVRDAHHLDQIRQKPGVAEIVCYPVEDTSVEGNISGPVLKPARLDPEALQSFVNDIARGEVVEPIGIREGQSVIVTDGPFQTFPAIVEKVLPNNRVKVNISIFGRPSPAMLGLAQVQAM